MSEHELLEKFAPYVKSWRREFYVRAKMQLPREHRPLDIERQERAKDIIELYDALTSLKAELRQERTYRKIKIAFLNNQIDILQAELAAHKENEGDECPLCACEAENERLIDENFYLSGRNTALSNGWHKMKVENEMLKQLVLLHGHLPSCPQFTGPYDLDELEPVCNCGYALLERK
jgi:hypothetical protein